MRRRLGRGIALQSLYQMEMNQIQADLAIQHSIDEALNENEGNIRKENEKINPEFIRQLVHGTLQHAQQIDSLLENYLKGWKKERLSKVDYQILRIATYEMLFSDEVPPKVAVNEAVELAKQFGTEESGKFVNGVLGKMLKEIDHIKQLSGSE